jgi:hypothetical protein
VNARNTNFLKRAHRALFCFAELKTLSPSGASPQAGQAPSSQAGQATVEYILILSFALTFAIFLTRGLISSVDRGMLRLGSQIEKDLKSGRAALGAWSN